MYLTLVGREPPRGDGLLAGQPDRRDVAQECPSDERLPAGVYPSPHPQLAATPADPERSRGGAVEQVAVVVVDALTRSVGADDDETKLRVAEITELKAF